MSFSFDIYYRKKKNLVNPNLAQLFVCASSCENPSLLAKFMVLYVYRKHMSPISTKITELYEKHVVNKRQDEKHKLNNVT